MNGCGKVYTEGGNPEPKMQIFYVFIYMWALFVKSSISWLQYMQPQRLSIE